MQWQFIDKMCPFIRKFLDKMVEKYIAERIEKVTGKNNQLDTLKNLLVEEVQEKHFWKKEVDKVKWVEREKAFEFIEETIDRTIGITLNLIKKRYRLIPKGQNIFSEALCERIDKD